VCLNEQCSIRWGDFAKLKPNQTELNFRTGGNSYLKDNEISYGPQEIGSEKIYSDLAQKHEVSVNPNYRTFDTKPKENYVAFANVWGFRTGNQTIDNRGVVTLNKTHFINYLNDTNHPIYNYAADRYSFGEFPINPLFINNSVVGKDMAVRKQLKKEHIPYIYFEESIPFGLGTLLKNVEVIRQTLSINKPEFNLKNVEKSLKALFGARLVDWVSANRKESTTDDPTFEKHKTLLETNV